MLGNPWRYPIDIKLLVATSQRYRNSGKTNPSLGYKIFLYYRLNWTKRGNYSILPNGCYVSRLFYETINWIEIPEVSQSNHELRMNNHRRSAGVCWSEKKIKIKIQYWYWYVLKMVPGSNPNRKNITEEEKRKLHIEVNYEYRTAEWKRQEKDKLNTFSLFNNNLSSTQQKREFYLSTIV